MSLADRFTNPTQPKGPGHECSVKRALDNLPPRDRKVFVIALGSPEQPGDAAGVIYGNMQAERRDLLAKAAEVNDLDQAAGLRWLAEVHNVGHQTISRHRGRKCRCFKEAA